MPAEIESWLPIAGYEGLYEVSDHGHVRSLPRQIIQPSTQHGVAVARRIKGTVLKTRPRKAGGYLLVRLYKEGASIGALVHRLVLDAFVGPCPEGAEACHNDGDASNNTLANLRWDSHANNLADRHLHGTYSPPAARLTETEVRTIRDLAASADDLARQFKVSKSTIIRIRKRHAWRHIA